jgi:hypothetical protein
MGIQGLLAAVVEIKAEVLGDDSVMELERCYGLLGENIVRYSSLEGTFD